ncbi:MAG: hypothetical protein B6242_06525 [Anaerolineaceae bacterium 4572_78]|nr:MAG: hypothetical protein B6242_06525 [Anaerolineaceae bacterium 4572_78]
MYISIVLPTFDERDNITSLIDRTLVTLNNYDLEIIVVDDDSPDGTWQLVQEKEKIDSRVRLIRRVDENGLTSAIQRGITESKGTYIGWMDCDLSMPPEDWAKLVKAIENGADMVIGSRYVSDGADVAHSLTGRTLSRVINLGASLLLDWGIKDYTSGFILAHRKIFEQITLRGDYGEYCIDLLYRTKRANFMVQEVPYTCVPRESGESKTATNVWGYITRGVNYVKTVSRLRLS